MSIEFDVTLHSKQLEQEIEKINRKVSDFIGSTESQFNNLDNSFRRIGQAAAGYFTLAFGKEVAMNIANIRGEMQQLEIALTTMLGSGDKAKELTNTWVEMAAKTPFSLQEIAQGGKQLLAFNEPVEMVTETLRRLGDIAAGVSAPIGDIIRAYGQVGAKGRLQAEELNQFAERGVPVISELAKVLGVADKAVLELVSRGKVGFAELQQAIVNMTSDGGKFANLMEQQSASITGAISNLKDSIAQMYGSLGESNEGVIYGTIQTLGTLVENYETVLDVLKGIAVTYGVYKAAVIASTAVQKIHEVALLETALAGRTVTVWEAAHIAVLKGVQRAQMSVNATFMANPYVAVATAIAAMVAALVILLPKTKDLEKQFSELSDKINTTRENLDKMQSLEKAASRYDDLAKKVNKTNEEMKEFNDLIKELSGFDFSNLGEGGLSKYFEKSREIAKQSLADQRSEMQKLLSDTQAQMDKIMESLNSGKTTKTVTIQTSNFGGFDQVTTEAELTPEEINKLSQEYQRLFGLFTEYSKKLNETNEQITDLSGTQQQEAARTLDVIDKEIEAEKKKQRELSTSRKEYLEYQANINRLEAEKARIQGASKDQVKDERDRLKSLEVLAEQEIELKQRVEFSKVAAMKEGREKQLAEIERDYQYEIQMIQRLAGERLKVMNQSLPEDKKVDVLPQNEQALFDELWLLAATKRSKEIEAINQQSADRVKEIWKTASEFFITQQALEIQAVTEKYDSLIKEAKEFGDADLVAQLQKSKNAEIDKINRDYAMSRIESEKQINDSLMELSQSEILFNKRKYLQLLNQAKAYELERLKIAKADPKTPEADVKAIELRIKEIENAIVNFKKASAQELVSVITDVSGFLGEYNEIFKGISSVSSGVGKVLQGDLTGFLQIYKGITQLFDLQGKKEEERYKAMVEAMNSYIDNIDLQFEMIGRSIDRAFGEDKLNGFRKGIQAIGRDLTWAISEINRLAKVSLTIPGRDAIIGYRGDSVSGAGAGRPGGQPIFGYSIEGIEKAIAENEKRIDKLTLEYEKTGDDRVKQVLDAYQKWVGELYNLKDTYMELLTGTSPGGIADAIVQGFQQGKRSAQDFADDFEDMIKQALISAMKIKVLEEPLTGFYAQFADAMDDGVLTPEERIQLRSTYDRILELARQWGDSIEQTLGFDPFGTETQQQKGMAGQIKGITEETASMIAGQFYAMRELDQKVYSLMAANLPDQTGLLGYNKQIADIQQKAYMTGLEQLDVLNQSVTHLAEIAANTRYNKELVTIRDEMKSMNNYLKSAI